MAAQSDADKMLDMHREQLQTTLSRFCVFSPFLKEQLRLIQQKVEKSEEKLSKKRRIMSKRDLCTFFSILVCLFIEITTQLTQIITRKKLFFMNFISSFFCSTTEKKIFYSFYRNLNVCKYRRVLLGLFFTWRRREQKSSDFKASTTFNWFRKIFLLFSEIDGFLFKQIS